MHEAEAATSITHKNIVQIEKFGYTVSDTQHIPFIVMEYIEGQSLKYYIKRNIPLTYWQKARIVKQVADSLVAIHEKNICHRDIKPENILIEKNLNVKLIDFGIARLPDSDITLDGDLLGSPMYLSPEAFISARNVDFRSDLFSLGSVAYELFTGRHPFTGKNIQELSRKIRSSSPVDLQNLPSDFPNALIELLGKMMRKKPKERFTCARDIVTSLNKFLDAKDPKVACPLPI